MLIAVNILRKIIIHPATEFDMCKVTSEIDYTLYQLRLYVILIQLSEIEIISIEWECLSASIDIAERKNNLTVMQTEFRKNFVYNFHREIILF